MASEMIKLAFVGALTSLGLEETHSLRSLHIWHHASVEIQKVKKVLPVLLRHGETFFSLLNALLQSSIFCYHF